MESDATYPAAKKIRAIMGEFTTDAPGRLCWECGTPLRTDAEQASGIHEHCARAYLGYVERWGDIG